MPLLRANVRVLVKDRHGRILHVSQHHNLITDAGLAVLAATLRPAADGRLRYMAWGTSDTAVDPADTQLGSEQGRVAVTSQQAVDTTTITVVSLTSGHANGVHIKELGWFAGPDATTETGSGILYARVLYDREKTPDLALQIERTDTIGAA